MPLPSPRKDETEEEWMHRCMGHKNMNSEFPEMKQRAAVCHQKFRDKGKKNKKSEIAELDGDFLKAFLEKYPQYRKFFEENYD